MLVDRVQLRASRVRYSSTPWLGSSPPGWASNRPGRSRRSSSWADRGRAGPTVFRIRIRISVITADTGSG